MRYNEIITEANYRNKIDTSRTYPTQAEFDAAMKSKFGASGPNRESNPQAGGGIYLMNAKGIVGYKVPNTDSPEGYVWYLVKEPFMPATKKKAEPAATVAPSVPVTKPVAKPAAAPKAATPMPEVKTVDIRSVLADLLSTVKSIRTSSMWGNYDARGPEQDGQDWMAEIRDWGNWQVPDGEEDDGDYDWEELTDESGAKLQKIVDEYAKRYPTIKFSWQTGEKNWIYFYARAK